MILKCPFGIFKSSKPTKFFPGFLPKPLKRSQIKIISGLFTANLRILFWLSYTFFLICPLFRGYAEILGKFLLVFWKIWWHLTSITDPNCTRHGIIFLMTTAKNIWPQCAMLDSTVLLVCRVCCQLTFSQWLWWPSLIRYKKLSRKMQENGLLEGKIRKIKAYICQNCKKKASELSGSFYK